MRYKLHYQVFGTGRNTLLAFHGFGQDSSIFAELAAALPECTVYSFDLFFHGKSQWFDSLDHLTPTLWQTILTDFLVKHQIDRFSIVGYSMGGRMAMLAAQYFANKIDKFWLIAPDGILLNAWYRVATKHTLLQKVFRWVTHTRPESFDWLVALLRKLKGVHPSLLRLAQTQMSTPQLRKRLYQTWMLHRNLEVEINNLAKILNQQSVRLECYIGKYDRIITKEVVEKLLNLLENKQLHILNAGHERLPIAVAEHLQLQKTILQP